MYKKILKKSQYLTIMFAMLISSCSVGNSNPKTEVFKIVSNSTLKNGLIEGGKNMIFSYSKSFDPIPQAVDDEYSNSIIFEITQDEKETFLYENENLAKINAYSIHSCFCPPETTAPKPLLKGKIAGKKISPDTWKIDSTNELISFSGEFRLTK